MNELIALTSSTIGDDEVQTVNARDLHSYLKVGKDFSTWIKGRIEQYSFTEGQDFVKVASPQVWGVGNRGNSTEYHLTIDMAKELSMVEKTFKGNQARKYFIACERELKTNSAPRLPNMRELALMVVDAEDKRVAAEAKALLLEHDKLVLTEKIETVYKPQAAVCRQFVESGASLGFREAAKAMNVKEALLKEALVSLGWFPRNRKMNCDLGHGKKWAVDQGFTEIKFHPDFGPAYLLTPKGMAKAFDYLKASSIQKEIILDEFDMKQDWCQLSFFS